eukprot:gene9629-7543_t
MALLGSTFPPPPPPQAASLPPPSVGSHRPSTVDVPGTAKALYLKPSRVQGHLLGVPGSHPSPDKGTSWQYLVAMCAISVVICYADRSNLSTAVLPMSEEFGWDKGYQGLVLSSFFAGYALTQILGGQLADKYGGKLVLASGVAIWSFFTWATPIVAAQGTAPLIAARVLLGETCYEQAFKAVRILTLFLHNHPTNSTNVPYEKQSTAVGIVTAASYVGIAVAFGISPMIISEYGWHDVFYLFGAAASLWRPFWLPLQISDTYALPHLQLPVLLDVFYLFGGAALLWLPFWLPLQISDNLRPPAPATPSIANASPPAPAQAASEQATSSSETTDEDKGLTTTSLTTSTTTPGFELEGLKALLKRKEVWAICAAQYTGSWGLYGLLSWLPTFFSEYYGVPIEDLAGYTFLPYIVQGGTGMLAGVAADMLLSNG